MWFSRKQGAKSQPVAVPDSPAQAAAGVATAQPTTKSRGDAAESSARGFLVKAGLKFVEANFKTPGRGGGEIDLIMRARDGTLVFVEVRQRASASHGGAGASIGRVKQQRIVLAAQHYLLRFARVPPCRFDVVLVEGTLSAAEGVRSSTPPRIEWLVGAFDAF